MPKEDQTLGTPLEDRTPSTPGEDQTLATPKEEPHTSPTHFSELLLAFELKQDKHNPFCDKPTGPNAQFESAHILAQGQIAAILNEMLSYSFRTHAYLVFVDGHAARLFHTGRAGIIVSGAFSYLAHVMDLIGFLYRSGGATPSQREIDMAVNCVSGEIQVPRSSFAQSYIKVKLPGGAPTH